VRIGIVIVSYNTAALLRRCLHALEGTRTAHEIVVVDNASQDGSAALVAAEFPQVRLLALPRNLGYAGGTNAALAQLGADCDSILILNPDTEASAGAVDVMAEFLAQHPRIGVVGPRLLNPDGTLQRAAFRFPTVISAAIDLFPPGEVLPGRLYDSAWHGRYAAELRDEPFAVDYPLGACMLVRRAVIDEVGPMDEGYFMYSEEVDWCRRIKAAGWAIWQVPAARVTHVGGAATSQTRVRMLVALWAARERYAAKYASRGQQRLLRRLLRAAMVRLTLLAWWGYWRGQIEHGELQRRLLAYGLIARGTPVAGAAG
jgi:N-acetylglucosaminyl-diphospho-decaprenol L-rhamnosyltransferase